jgi:DNA-binding GntR family transcriptional regulator
MGSLPKLNLPGNRRKPFGEEIASALQREIIGGLLKPGQRIVERQIVERFGVSSIPVREALQLLESRGLLVRRHNAGCSVIKLTKREAGRICEIRRLLEPQVVRWAAERITQEAAERLREQFRRLEQTAAQRDFACFFQEDVVFHRMIWEAADNPYATRSMEIIVGSLFASGLIGAEQRAAIDIRAEVEKHRRLLEAICAHDAPAAHSALLEIATGFESHVPGDGVD